MKYCPNVNTKDPKDLLIELYVEICLKDRQRYIYEEVRKELIERYGLSPNEASKIALEYVTELGA